MARHNRPELQYQRTKLLQMQNGSLRESRVQNIVGILVSDLQGWKRDTREQKQKGEETGLVAVNPTVALRHCNSKNIKQLPPPSNNWSNQRTHSVHTHKQKFRLSPLKGSLIPRIMKTSEYYVLENGLGKEINFCILLCARAIYWYKVLMVHEGKQKPEI